MEQATVEKLKAMTDENDHVEAWVLGCGLIGATDLAEKLKSLMYLGDRNGYSGADYQKVEAVYVSMMGRAKANLTAEDYEAFYGCF